MPTTVRVIDSHTGGEPTRLIVEGGPALAGETVAQKALDFAVNHAEFRTGVLLEPRGSDVWVGALLLPPSEPDCTAGVIFFNNVGVLGMCGHGTIGLVASLAYSPGLAAGSHRIETPVGVVTTWLNEDGSVTVKNVLSYRHAKDVVVRLSGGKVIVGDVAWGGNWFYIVEHSPIPVEFRFRDELTALSTQIKSALIADNVVGADGGEIDHIELCGPPNLAGANSKNFVLCPGNAYDRSPCGTGTSAKLACLAAAGKLAPGQNWRQESIVGSYFDGSYEQHAGGVIPSITGRAFVTAESTLVFQDGDPFRDGIV